MGLDRTFPKAFAKAQLGASTVLPLTGSVFVSVRDSDKPRILPVARKLSQLGFALLATGGTQRYLSQNGLECARVNKVLEGRPHIEDAIRNRRIDLIVNTSEGSKARRDSRSIRQAALASRVAYYTTIAGCQAAADAIAALSKDALEVMPVQDYFD